MKVWTLFIDDPGPGCSFTEEQLADMLNDIREANDHDNLCITVREMSEREFDTLPEFEGY